jgi:hypothetical protein
MLVCTALVMQPLAHSTATPRWQSQCFTSASHLIGCLPLDSHHHNPTATSPRTQYQHGVLDMRQSHGRAVSCQFSVAVREKHGTGINNGMVYCMPPFSTRQWGSIRATALKGRLPGTVPGSVLSPWASYPSNAPPLAVQPYPYNIPANKRVLMLRPPRQLQLAVIASPAQPPPAGRAWPPAPAGSAWAAPLRGTCAGTAAGCRPSSRLRPRARRARRRAAAPAGTCLASARS